MKSLWKAALAVTLSILTVALIMAGCSDDDAVTNNPGPTQYTLTVNITPDSTGTVTLNPGKANWLAGDTTVLTAAAESLYVFDHWEYFGVDLTENPLTLAFDSSRNEVITAVFADKQYSLTVNITPDAAGTVVLDPDQSSWTDNDTVVLTAVADTFFAFDHWEYFGAAVTGNPVTLTFEDDRDEEITAVFVDDSLSRLVTLEGIAYSDEADLQYPLLIFMSEGFDTVLAAWELEGGNDTASFFVQFSIEDYPGSYIHVVDNLDNDLIVFEDGEPYQCYDSDDPDINCDFITYTEGQVIEGLVLQMFIPVGAGEYTPLEFRPIKLEK